MSTGTVERTGRPLTRREEPRHAGSWYADLGGRGRRAFRAAYAGYMLDAFDLIVLTLSLTAIGATFDLGTGATGALSTVTLSASAIGGVLGGVLADRIGRARTLMLSVGVYSLFTFLSGIASSYEMLLVFRVFQGIGFGAEWGVGAVLVAELVRPEARGKALGVIQSAWATGWALAVVAYLITFGLFDETAAWRVLMCLGILPALLILYIRRRVEDPKLFKASKDRTEAEFPLKRIFRRDLLKTTIAASVLATGIQGGYYAMFTWIPTYLKEERDLTIIGTSGYLFVVIAGAFLGYLSAGFVHDRLGRKRTFALFASLAGHGARPVLPGARGLQRHAAAGRLPARLLRVRVLLGLRLVPERAVPDAGARDRRRLLLQRRPRLRSAVPGHHRVPGGVDRAGRRRRFRRVRLRAGDLRADAAAGDARAEVRACGVAHSVACCASGTSVTNMWPGACVIISSGRLAAATAWGVTPQAQNTGISPSRSSTASP